MPEDSIDANADQPQKASPSPLLVWWMTFGVFVGLGLLFTLNIADVFGISEQTVLVVLANAVVVWMAAGLGLLVGSLTGRKARRPATDDPAAPNS